MGVLKCVCIAVTARFCMGPVAWLLWVICLISRALVWILVGILDRLVKRRMVDRVGVGEGPCTAGPSGGVGVPPRW